MAQAIILLAVVLTAAAAARWGRIWTVPLAAASLWWLAVDKDMEGPVLLQVGRTHGLVAADLAGLGGIGLAVLVLVLGPPD